MVGIYFGREGARKRLIRISESLEFLVGGRKLKLFPVSMSLIASWLSAISLLGVSTEVYVYGYYQILTMIGSIVALIGICFLVLPVYYEMGITSVYEYLGERFDRRLRIFGSFLFLLNSVR